MPRSGLTPERVITEAALLADEVGFDNLTLAALAQRLGVRLPSLYKHVDGLGALRRHLSVRAKRELTDVLARATAGRARSDALRALGIAYRDWALAHPGLYLASVRAPAPDDPEDQEASSAAVHVLFDILAGDNLAPEAVIDVTRSLRAGLHGYVTLAQQGAFALERRVEDSVAWLLESLDTAIRSHEGNNVGINRP